MSQDRQTSAEVLHEEEEEETHPSTPHGQDGETNLTDTMLCTPKADYNEKNDDDEEMDLTNIHPHCISDTEWTCCYCHGHPSQTEAAYLKQQFRGVMQDFYWHGEDLQPRSVYLGKLYRIYLRCHNCGNCCHADCTNFTPQLILTRHYLCEWCIGKENTIHDWPWNKDIDAWYSQGY